MSMGAFYADAPYTPKQSTLSPLMRYEVEFTLHRLASWDHQELSTLAEGLEVLIEQKSGSEPEQK